MDRKSLLLDRLALAERHVSQGMGHVGRQREIVAELELHGHDATPARDLLRLFEELQALHIADRDRLRQELAKAS